MGLLHPLLLAVLVAAARGWPCARSHGHCLPVSLFTLTVGIWLAHKSAAVPASQAPLFKLPGRGTTSLCCVIQVVRITFVSCHCASLAGLHDRGEGDRGMNLWNAAGTGRAWQAAVHPLSASECFSIHQNLCSVSRNAQVPRRCTNTVL